MSWHADVEFFKQAINVIEDKISSEYEQVIYQYGLLNMLEQRDLEIEYIERHVLAHDKLDRRCSLYNKYYDQIEDIFKGVRSPSVFPYVLASTKESVERSELNSLESHSSNTLCAFIEIMELSVEYEVDDEFLIGDLASVFRLTEEDIDRIRPRHPKLATRCTAYENEKIAHYGKIDKTYSRLKNYSEIQKKVKTVEKNWKSALAKERKKALGVSSKDTKGKSESKTIVENKIIKDQSELISKYPYSADDLRKYDSEIASTALEVRQALIKRIKSKTKVSSIDIELVLDFIEESLLDSVLSKKGWDLFDLLHIEVVHTKGGTKHKIENPSTGKPMTFKSNNHTVSGTLSPRLKWILDAYEIDFQALH